MAPSTKTSLLENWLNVPAILEDAGLIEKEIRGVVKTGFKFSYGGNVEIINSLVPIMRYRKPKFYFERESKQDPIRLFNFGAQLDSTEDIQCWGWDGSLTLYIIRKK
jgi:hypothetical protein